MESLILPQEEVWSKVSLDDLVHPVFVSPTDTVYGFGARFGDPQGFERLRQLKGRDGPFIVLARSLDEVMEHSRLSAVHEIILKQYWPGPITFILPTAEQECLAFRVPDHPFLMEAMDRLGGPMLSTSCNRPGEPVITDIDMAAEVFGDKVDFYVDGGTLPQIASTLVDMTGSRPEVIRPGSRTFP